jgi:hypothetical protein
MDLTTILANAEKAGYTTVTLDEKDFNLGGKYIIYFIKNFVVEGYFKVIPGEGMQWHYPQGLVDYVNNQEKPSRHVYEEDIF